MRETKDTFSSVLGHKDQGAIVHGWKDGHWLHLVDEPGFMMISLKGIPFLEQSDEAHAGEAKVLDKVVARKYSSHVHDSAVAARGHRWELPWPVVLSVSVITAAMVSFGICMKATWRSRFSRPSADVVERNHKHGVLIPMVVYRRIPEDDHGGSNN